MREVCSVDQQPRILLRVVLLPFHSRLLSWRPRKLVPLVSMAVRIMSKHIAARHAYLSNTVLRAWYLASDLYSNGVHLRHFNSPQYTDLCGL